MRLPRYARNDVGKQTFIDLTAVIVRHLAVKGLIWGRDNRRATIRGFLDIFLRRRFLSESQPDNN